MSGLTHIDPESGAAHMVDVSAKPETRRIAVAAGMIRMSDEALRAVAENRAAKGDVLAVARVAGIMAAKRTGELIPLCHPLGIDSVTLDLDIVADGVAARATVGTFGRTGVEMEAMTAVSVALLTVYDMLKAVDRGMRIEAVRLVEKRGGKSGTWVAA